MPSAPQLTMTSRLAVTVCSATFRRSLLENSPPARRYATPESETTTAEQSSTNANKHRAHQHHNEAAVNEQNSGSSHQWPPCPC